MYRLILLHITETYYRHRWLYLMPIIVMLVAAGIYLTVVKVEYESKGVILVNEQSLLSSLSSLDNNSSNLWVTPAQATASEINQLLETDAFIRAIIKQTELEVEMSGKPEDIQQLLVDTRDQIVVSILGDKQTSITAKHTEPKIAYQLVNSLLNNYIQWKLNSQKTESETALNFFAGLIENYQTELDLARTNLKSYVLNHPAPVRGDRPFLEQFEIEYLNSEISAAKERYSKAVSNRENAELSQRLVETNIHQKYVIIDAPEVPLKPNTSLKSIAMQLGIFLGIGFLISIVLVYVSSVMDNTVRFPQDITAHTELPVLAVVPETLTERKPAQKIKLKLPQVKTRFNWLEKFKLTTAHNHSTKK